LPPILTLTYLTGHPQEWFLLVITLSVGIAADAVSILLQGRRGILPGLGRLASWAVILATTLCLAAIELVPTLKVLPWVQKGAPIDGGLVVPKNYQVNLASGFQLLSPEALGGPGDYFGVDNYWESVLSVGFVPLVLIVVAAVADHRLSRVRGWVAMVALSVWFATGRQFGPFGLLYWLLPGMGWFRVPARSLFLASLGAAILAGYGLEALQVRLSDTHKWRRFGSRLASIGALLIGLLALFNTLCAPGGSGWRIEDVLSSENNEVREKAAGALNPWAFRASKNALRVWWATGRILHDPPFWITVSALSATISLGCLSSRWPIRRSAVNLIGLLALGELAWHGFALIRVAPVETFFGPDPICESLLLLDPKAPSGEPPRVRARDAFFLDLQAVRYGVEKTNINDVFQLAHAAMLYETLYPVATRVSPLPETPMSWAVDDDRRQIRQGVFDRMAVSYLVSDRVEADPAWPVVGKGSRHERSFVIQRNPTAMPRSYTVPRAKVVPDDPAMVLSRFRSSDPREVVLMNHDPLAFFSNEFRQPFTPARWLSIDPDRPVLEVTCQAPGLLVIADTWMPGWSANVDGKPSTILRGNYAQRVIPLEKPGHHIITLRYRPPGFELGLAITLCSVMAWGVTCCGASIYRLNRRTPPFHSLAGGRNQAPEYDRMKSWNRYFLFRGASPAAEKRLRSNSPKWSVRTL
jgi:hypothetical protein